MFAQLGSLFSGGALPWDMTRQVATWTATGGTSEPNIVPVERIRLEELVRIALPHVEELAEVPVVGAGSVSVDAVTRAGWVADFLDQQRNLIERLAASLSRSPSDPTEAGGPAGAGADPFRGLLRMLGPSIVAMQVGGMAGQLATRALSGFDLPLPRTGRALDRLVLVPVAIDEFADAWGLPRDDVRLRIILGELAHIAVMRAPGIAPICSTHWADTPTASGSTPTPSARCSTRSIRPTRHPCRPRWATRAASWVHCRRPPRTPPGPRCSGSSPS